MTAVVAIDFHRERLIAVRSAIHVLMDVDGVIGVSVVCRDDESVKADCYSDRRIGDILALQIAGLNTVERGWFDCKYDRKYRAIAHRGRRYDVAVVIVKQAIRGNSEISSKLRDVCIQLTRDFM